MALLTADLDGRSYEARRYAMLKACLDKSSDHPCGLVVVAGYLGTLDQWSNIESKWNNGLCDWRSRPQFASLGYFHMSKLTRCIGQDLANDCMNFFARIISESELQAVGAAVYEPDWRLPDWKHDKTQKLCSPYQQALSMTLDVVGKQALARSANDGVSIVCCEDDKKSLTEETYHTAKQKYPSFVKFAIESAAQSIGLQCADLGSGLLRKSWGGIFKSDTNMDIWGSLPTGRNVRQATAFWSLRQASIIRRSIFLAETGRQVKY